MSGECDKCGEHTLDCMCRYPKCEVFLHPIYRYDSTCINCLVNSSKDLLKIVDEHLKGMK